MSIRSRFRNIAAVAVTAATLLALGVPASAYAADGGESASAPVAFSDDNKVAIAITGTSAAVKNHVFKAVRIGDYASADGVASTGTLNHVAVTTEPTLVYAAQAASDGIDADASYDDNPVGAVAATWLGFAAPGSEDTISNSGTDKDAWGKDCTQASDGEECETGGLRRFVTRLIRQRDFKAAIKDTAAAPVTFTDAGANSTATIAGLAPGIYVVEDTTGTQPDETHTNSIPMLVSTGITSTAGVSYGNINGQPLGTINMKNDAKPTITKQLDTSKHNDASIGGTLHYVITTQVPLTTGFSEYIFAITDTPKQPGLTYNSDDTTVTIGGKVMQEGIDYQIDFDGAANDGKGYVTFNLSYGICTKVWHDPIKIEYSMTVNDQAQPGALQNGVTLAFSNDSAHQSSGTGEIDGETGQINTDPVSENGSFETVTNDPSSTPTAYYRSFTLVNKDKATETPIPGGPQGATFQVSSKGGKLIRFRQLAPGSYRKVVDQSDDSGDGETSTTVNLQANSQGQLTVDGLGEQAYDVAQTEVPAGYAASFKPSFEVTLSGNGADGQVSNTGDIWGLVEAHRVPVAADTAIVVHNVTAVSQLPLTGGAGVALAVAVAVLLLMVAVSLMMFKRRQEAAAGIR